jgi:hypothetical protein
VVSHQKAIFLLIPRSLLRGVFIQLEMAGSLPLQVMKLESMRTDRNIRGSSLLSCDERRRAIVESVKGVFAEKGFDGTTTRELAKVAGTCRPAKVTRLRSQDAQCCLDGARGRRR